MPARRRTRHIKQVWFRLGGTWLTANNKKIELNNTLGHNWRNGYKAYINVDDDNPIYVKPTSKSTTR